MADLLPSKRLNGPTPFGKYFLLERINVGGMAEVFKAKALGVEGFERLLAVKRILPNIAEDEEFITMFIDEAKIAVQLQHANIAQIFDLGKVDDSYFIALEYVHGKDLRAISDLLKKTDEAMPLAQACFVVMQLCEGLDYAHNKRDGQGRELNLVHRDVSPQNVLLGYEGEIKLVDFGIAKAAGKASKTQAGILKGKFGYMSPEQVRGLPVDRRSDIFSLGIVLYELLTGERLFVGESDFSTLEKVRNVEILPPSSFNKKIPAELERIVLKALAKDVEDRYQNAIDLHDDLQAFLYSVGDLCSRKDLAGWMKRTFADELADENAKLAGYQQFDRFDEPTPAPPRSSPGVAPVRPGSAPKAAARAGRKDDDGLAWDEEELETQIFDKPPDDVQDAELDTGDILLQESDGLGGDDRTVTTTPPAALLAEEAAQGGRGFGVGPGAYRGEAPGGPPPGLAGFRQGGNGDPLAARVAPFEGMPPRTAFESPRGIFKQTLTGIPPVPFPAPVSSLPERRPLEHLANQRARSGSPALIVALALVAAAGYGGYRYFTRPGKVQIQVKPADARISVEGVTLEGTPPMTIEREPGLYQLTIERAGYVRRDQNFEVQPGQFERVEIELEPSPDTGFELTSEPPGGLVWLDGQPFTSGDGASQQARTNFKAYRVAPGRHVLEIKGDPRFEEWRTEFFQEPGKTMKVHAELVPKGATPPVSAAPTPRPADPPKPAVVAPRPAETPPPPRAEPVRPATRPRPRPVARAARSHDEDVFEKETKLGAPAEECTITLGSKPWAEVWLGGKKVGLTPLVGYKVPCGRHKVTFKNPDLKIERDETISVRAGEKLKKVFPLVDAEE